ncbi:hypothetical protein AVEN_6043-1 [Araneus ventricosus]|uniref:Uncharacterized protein n=1 Tax=Araneus ventricosus TaxID=182803 RepID=A0A4Y2FZ73_ARAVE|nr:hypothetical protein AVEN_6043-1 [Araneus ventricosus]
MSGPTSGSNIFQQINEKSKIKLSYLMRSIETKERFRMIHKTSPINWPNGVMETSMFYCTASCIRCSLPNRQLAGVSRFSTTPVSCFERTSIYLNAEQKHLDAWSQFIMRHLSELLELKHLSTSLSCLERL